MNTLLAYIDGDGMYKVLSKEASLFGKVMVVRPSHELNALADIVKGTSSLPLTNVTLVSLL